MGIPKGFKHTEETKRKMSAARLGKKNRHDYHGSTSPSDMQSSGDVQDYSTVSARRCRHSLWEEWHGGGWEDRSRE